MNGNILFLIAGHSTGEVGAVTRDTNEAKEAKYLRNAIANTLFMNNENTAMHDTIFTSYLKETCNDKLFHIVTDPNDFTLKQVVKQVNSIVDKEDLLISFHFNAFNGKARGTEALVYHGSNDKTKKLAEELTKVCAKVIKTPNRGVKFENSGQHSRLAILNDTICNSILLEVCFIDNEKDMKGFRDNNDMLISKIMNQIKKYYE